MLSDELSEEIHSASYDMIRFLFVKQIKHQGTRQIKPGAMMFFIKQSGL
ncbi:hypothetical protein BPJM79_100024 [Bacillus pumilus]